MGIRTDSVRVLALRRIWRRLPLRHARRPAARHVGELFLSADLRAIYIAPHGLSGHFQSDDAQENEADTGKPTQRRGTIEHTHTERRRADGAPPRHHRTGPT